MTPLTDAGDAAKLLEFVYGHAHSQWLNEVIQSGHDPHTETARAALGLGSVSTQQRLNAKKANFGFLYSGSR